MSNTVTGRVIATEYASTSMYGNPAYWVTLDNGETYRTMDNAGLAYAIGNTTYRDTPHTFTLTAAGRIRNAKPIENSDTLDILDTWDIEPLYTVYLLVDGMAEDIYDGDSFDKAHDAFNDAVRVEQARRGRHVREGSEYVETSVHLYEPHYGVMHAEHCIEQV